MQVSRCEKINKFFLVGNELNTKCNFGKVFYATLKFLPFTLKL
jgi:hypothetical protein